MLLDKQIREKIVEILKADAGVLTLVDASNILDFPVRIDMNFTPAIGVYTLNTSDESERNNPKHYNTSTVHIEITAKDIITVDDIENLVDEAIVQDIPWGSSFGGIAELEKPYFMSSEVNYDDEGTTLRISKNVLYGLKYQTAKGKITDTDVLEGIDGEMIYEDVADSQLDNEVLINY